MRNLAKKALALLCVMAMLFSLTVVVQAEDKMTITVGDVEAAAGDTIQVPVNLSNNTVGLTGLTLEFTYDADVLAYTSATKGEALPDMALTKPGASFTEGKIRFLWDNMDPDYTNGEILVITFTVAEDAAGDDYAVDVEVISACDGDLNDIEVAAVDGTVTVAGADPMTITVGDVEAAAGDTIQVPVNLSNNTVGLTGLTLEFTYDADVLAYTSATKGEALPDMALTKPGASFTEGKIRFLWDNMDPDYTNGEILVITFTVAEDAAGDDYAVDVEVISACDGDLNDIEVAAVDGTVTVEAAAHEHSWDEGEVTTAPTHTTKGVMTYTCECGETKTEDIPENADDHTYDTWSRYDNENHRLACECSDVILEAHNWDDGNVGSQPTATEDGTMIYTCTVCGEQKFETIPAGTGDTTGGTGETTGGTGETTGDTTGGTGETTGDTTGGTGETTGDTTGGTGETTGDTTGGTGETTGDTTGGTGETTGDTTGGTGETTGDTTGGSGENDPCATGHTWDAGVVTTPATRYATGVKTYTCSVCGDTKTETIPKITGGGGGSSSTPSKPEEPKDEEPTDKPVSITNFGDVNASDWFYSAVEFAINNGLMVGTSEDKFDPYMNTTRGMIVTVLYRLENEPAVEGSTTFTDVNPNAYYADAVIWAQQNGIVSGFSETEFAPDVNVTREQLVAIMQRYAEFKGYDTTHGEDVDLIAYDDHTNVSDWAVEAMKYGVGSGLIYGRSETTINPLDNAMRAEFAAIMQRFITANN